MLAHIEPVIYGDGNKIRDYIYIADVVAANVRALSWGTNQIFNIASGMPTRDIDVFHVVRELLGMPEVRCRYTAVRPGEIDKIVLDVSKANQLLGWEPRITLQAGAKPTVAFFQRAAKKTASAG